jgi:hypothetical protein
LKQQKHKSIRISCEEAIMRNRDRQVAELFSELEREIIREQAGAQPSITTGIAACASVYRRSN